MKERIEKLKKDIEGAIVKQIAVIEDLKKRLGDAENRLYEMQGGHLACMELLESEAEAPTLELVEGVQHE